MIKVEMINHPSEEDWIECKRRALVTIGKDSDKKPSLDWMSKILEARHSPIRFLQFGFYIECPYWVSVHLVRHVHAQPYVRSQRNDRQDMYDRNSAPQNEQVSMIWDMNAEELMVIMNKRLCKKASPETQEVVRLMRNLVLESNPEFAEHLIPMCIRESGCHEIKSCGFYERIDNSI